MLVLVALLCACAPAGHHGNGDDNYFSGFTSFSGARWNYGHNVTVSPDTLHDSVAAGHIALTVRHSANYRYSNIWLELTHRADSMDVAVDTLEIKLADAYGRWYGKGSGASFMISDTLPQIYRISRGDTLRLRHIMRLDTLEEVEQAGISFLPLQ